MSFRWRLIIGISLAVLLTASVYGVLGYFIFKRALDAETALGFVDLQQAVTDSISFTNESPVLTPTAELQTILNLHDAGFRLQVDDYIILQGGRPLTGDETWQKKITELGGYRLVLGLNVEEKRSILHYYIRTALFAISFAIAFALLVSLLLQPFLLRPLRELRQGVEQLSNQSIPEPIRVPAGNDELSQLAQTFNRTTTALQGFLERERSFTRYASHELRTPLSNFRALTEGLRKGILTPATTWPQIEETLLRMESILTGLLSLTRSPKLNPEPLSIVAVIQTTLQSLASDERIRVRFEAESRPLVMAQADLLGRVVSNLVGNALKYSDKGIVIQVVEDPTSVTMKVRDFGLGVPREALSKLSEPFFRVNKRVGGLGLGLALVHHITSALGGSVRFLNTSPGLEVSVSLPKVVLPKASRVDLPALEVFRTGVRRATQTVSQTTAQTVTEPASKAGQT